ncbi:hypothetical protein PMIN04_005961 [Paraphaeosphaeria minitans]
MDRRKEMRTDDSAISLTDSLKSLYLGISQYIIGDQEMNELSPVALLNRMLSTKSGISTSSSLAEESQRARDDAQKKIFHPVGDGQCGTVYALRGTTMVVKLPNNPQKSDELFRDFQMHLTIQNAFNTLPEKLRASYNINVPGVKVWVDPHSDHFWTEHASMFPGTGVPVPNYDLVSERIYPLPLPVRSAIVDALCPKEIQKQKTEFLARSDNKDCLVRIYLRRHSRDTPMTAGNVKLSVTS